MAMQYAGPEDMQIDPSKQYDVTMETDKGTINLRLYPDVAPQTVNSFVFLASEGFYDNLTFHRVEPGFVIQGGDPRGTGTGGPGYNIKAEFSDRPHKEGALAMARAGHPDSAGSQFYITLAPTPFLDRQYTVFGEVTSGMDVVKKIKRGDKIKSVTVSSS
jgi:peptidyl-prolyl cis-trans isomerase B (cyclophilin B)